MPCLSYVTMAAIDWHQVAMHALCFVMHKVMWLTSDRSTFDQTYLACLQAMGDGPKADANNGDRQLVLGSNSVAAQVSMFDTLRSF